ncbi:Vitamin B12 ABC transporter, permease protein BtuC [hydrothermal vent metagenome]|uniref:Vitamin B12 ABC transporter, permease protein BtuC n=1 Tax=hydrothermal vent metagenome TaxID=652676 RepID=A0A3B0XYD2_9ZZZZ
MRQPLNLLFILLLLSIASFAFAISMGSMQLSFAQLSQAFFNNDASIAYTIIWELRAPRAYIAFISGGLLSLAGVLMQVLLRNPLADPYILGVSGGASVAALLALSAGLGGGWVSGSAFIGALISISLVFGLAHAQGNWNPTRLLLTGVVIAAGWGAAINFILSISPDKPLRGMLFWLMGDISNITPDIAGLLVLLTGLIITFILARQLNVLSRGDLQASALGVSVKSLRITLFLLASALTAFAVTQAGSVGFVGLIVPHMIRLISGSDHRLLIPASVLLGGSLLVVSDTLARTIIAPQQLPVGVITAFLGVPFFLFLLSRAPKSLGAR